MKIFILIIVSLTFISCSGNLEKNNEQLDKVYGKCDNPARVFTDKQYKQCLAAENAKGESLFGLEGDLNDLIRGDKEKVVYQSTVNSYLWNAALDTTETFSLKIADNQGGIIETDWIYDTNAKRCLIRIRILSQELISTGVSTKFICQLKTNENWINDNIAYLDEEKQLTLKILEKANILKNSS